MRPGRPWEVSYDDDDGFEEDDEDEDDEDEEDDDEEDDEVWQVGRQAPGLS
jgi:hypothetical protein